MRFESRWIFGGIAIAAAVTALCKPGAGATFASTRSETPSAVTPNPDQPLSFAPKPLPRAAARPAPPAKPSAIASPPAARAPDDAMPYLRARAEEEQAMLANQDVTAAAVVFEHQQPALDHATRSRAEALVVNYATRRMALLNEMYEAYLSAGETYDPRSSLADLSELSETFRQEAGTLEERIPGVSRLSTMLDSTSLRLPTFVPMLLEDDG